MSLNSSSKCEDNPGNSREYRIDTHEEEDHVGVGAGDADAD